MKNKNLARRLFAAILILAFSLVAVSCGDRPPVQAEEEENSGYDTSWVGETVMPKEEGTSRALENISTLDLYGNHVDSAVFSDYEITIVDVWGTYCSPCIRAMPVLAALHEKYKEKGVNVIGIVVDVQNRDFSPNPQYVETAMEITESTGADFLHLLPSQNIVSSVVRNISAIPASFIVDSEGNMLTKIFYGGHTMEQWEELIDEYI